MRFTDRWRAASTTQPKIDLADLRQDVPGLNAEALAHGTPCERLGLAEVEGIEDRTGRHREHGRSRTSQCCSGLDVDRPLSHERQTDRYVDQSGGRTRAEGRKHGFEGFDSRQQRQLDGPGRVRCGRDPTAAAAIKADPCCGTRHSIQLRAGSRMVTNSSAAVGWMPTVASN